MGVASARNKGLFYSHGDSVCFIDSDDFIDSKKLIKCLHLYYKYHADLLISNLNFDNKNIGIKRVISLTNVKKFLENNYPLYGNELIHVTWNKIYNNSIIKKHGIKFPLNLHMGEDLVFVLRYILHLNQHMKIIQTGIAYYNYFIHKSSLTKQFDRSSFESKLLILKCLKKVYIRYGLSNKLINRLKTKAIYSVMLNGLRSNNKINYLKAHKKMILNNNSFYIIKNINFSLVDKILILFFNYMPIYIYYCFLKFLSIVRNLYNMIKY